MKGLMVLCDEMQSQIASLYMICNNSLQAGAQSLIIAGSIPISFCFPSVLW